MIGGLLRFAPGRLGACQDRAPECRGIRWWVVSWLPCGTPETSWNPSPRKEAWPGVLCEPGWQPAARCASGGWPMD